MRLHRGLHLLGAREKGLSVGATLGREKSITAEAAPTASIVFNRFFMTVFLERTMELEMEQELAMGKERGRILTINYSRHKVGCLC